MTASERIRQLGSEGRSVSEIAREVGVRYQHAYKVLRDAALLSPVSRSPIQKPEPIEKPALTSDHLLASGFVHSATWSLSEVDEILTDRSLPREVGVYALARKGFVLYVGVATMGLAKRLHFYRRPGISQKTSLRINALIKEGCREYPSITVLTATPNDFEWNGLPVSGAAGLELGLIKKFRLPWNIRSAG